MTEHEWQTSTDPEALLRATAAVRDRRRTDLFLAACCRRVWDWLPVGPLQEAVEALEREACGTAAPGELDAARATAQGPASNTFGWGIIEANIDWKFTVLDDCRQKAEAVVATVGSAAERVRAAEAAIGETGFAATDALIAGETPDPALYAAALAEFDAAWAALVDLWGRLEKAWADGHWQLPGAQEALFEASADWDELMNRAWEARAQAGGGIDAAVGGLGGMAEHLLRSAAGRAEQAGQADADTAEADRPWAIARAAAEHDAVLAVVYATGIKTIFWTDNDPAVACVKMAVAARQHAAWIVPDGAPKDAAAARAAAGAAAAAERAALADLIREVFDNPFGGNRA